MEPSYRNIKSLNDITVEIPEKGKKGKKVTWREFVKIFKKEK